MARLWFALPVGLWRSPRALKIPPSGVTSCCQERARSVPFARHGCGGRGCDMTVPFARGSCDISATSLETARKSASTRAPGHAPVGVAASGGGGAQRGSASRVRGSLDVGRAGVAALLRSGVVDGRRQRCGGGVLGWRGFCRRRRRRLRGWVVSEPSTRRRAAAVGACEGVRGGLGVGPGPLGVRGRPGGGAGAMLGRSRRRTGAAGSARAAWRRV